MFIKWLLEPVTSVSKESLTVSMTFWMTHSIENTFFLKFSITEIKCKQVQLNILYPFPFNVAQN